MRNDIEIYEVKRNYIPRTFLLLENILYLYLYIFFNMLFLLFFFEFFLCFENFIYFFIICILKIKANFLLFLWC